MGERLGIFGGTFDPVHKGHLAIAEAAREQCHLDKVLFVPVRIPPHKCEQRSLSDPAVRLEMLEAALQEKPYFEVSLLELEREGISYTVDTLEAVHKLYRPDSLWLIVGADHMPSFETWKDAKKILELARLVVAPRPGWNGPFYACGQGPFFELSMAPCPISSTEIRNKIAEGSAHSVSEWVPSRVWEIIKKYNLYGWKEERP